MQVANPNVGFFRHQRINDILADHNVEKQICDNKGGIAYLMADIAECTEKDLFQIYQAVSVADASIQMRLLF